MKYLFIIMAFVFTSVVFPKNNLEKLYSEKADFAFASCYVTITTTEFNPITGTNVSTTTTYYLGEVDYGSYGNNYTACKLRASTFVPELYNTP